MKLSSCRRERKSNLFVSILHNIHAPCPQVVSSFSFRYPVKDRLIVSFANCFVSQPIFINSYADFYFFVQILDLEKVIWEGRQINLCKKVRLDLASDTSFHSKNWPVLTQ